MRKRLDSELLVEVKDSIHELAKRGGITDERAFSAWYAINFFDIDEDSALEAADLDGGEDSGLDFIFSNRSPTQAASAS